MRVQVTRDGRFSVVVSAPLSMAIENIKGKLVAWLKLDAKDLAGAG